MAGMINDSQMMLGNLTRDGRKNRHMVYEVIFFSQDSDMMKSNRIMEKNMKIIGLTGFRGVGKSEFAKYLKDTHGFTSVHAFAGGKAASEAYFRHMIGPHILPELAQEMTHGEYRDVALPYLPKLRDKDGKLTEEHATPRYFMEMFGNFMATTLGPEWTLGVELDLLKRSGFNGNLIVESVVYEDEVIRANGGMIIRIDRPGAGSRGLKTCAAVERITPDAIFVNNGNSLEEAFSRFDDQFGFLPEVSPDIC